MYEEAEEREWTVGKVREYMAALTYREREIIKLRYGIGDGYTYTLEEVVKIFKVSRERVRQIEARALRKIKGKIQNEEAGK